MEKERVIFHMDGDAFFVGVEVAKNPKLKGLAVVTGEERGIVSALSYEAKALGIARGMPIFRVKKDFPKVKILPGDYASYVKYSAKMFEIVRRYADDVEEYSIDECFADLTGLHKPLKMLYKQIAEKIKKEINTELKLSVSIGLAPTKVLAKVASKWMKPNGLAVISRESAPDFLKATPIEKIWGIGPKTSEFLKKKGIHIALEFVNKDIDWIRNNLSKPYESIWRELRGEMVMRVDPVAKNTYSSIQKTRTFHPATNDKVFLLSELSKHTEDACAKARHYHLVAKKISFFLKTQAFKVLDFSILLSSPTNSPETLISIVRENFMNVWEKGIIYRTAGVVLQDLILDSNSQGNLFSSETKSKKFEQIHKRLDILENKFGKRLVHLASSHRAIKRKKVGIDSDDLDRDLLFL